MAFVRDMVSLKKELGKLGHEASVPYATEPHLKDSSFVENLEDNLKYCIEHDVMRENFREVSRHDAVLVLNKKRNNVDGYIGISALMEMAIAHFLDKKIFLYNPTPHFKGAKGARWAHEVAIMQPQIIHGKLRKIT